MSEVNKSREQLLEEMQALEAELRLYRNNADPEHGDASLDFEKLFHSLKTPASILDKQFRYQKINDACARYTGVCPEDLSGATPADIFDAQTFNEIFKPRMERCLAGEQVEFEAWIEFPAAGKRYMQVTYTPRTDSQGNVTGILHYCFDLTDRYDQEVLSSTILDTSTNAFWLADKQGRLFSVNNAAAEMLGYTREELLDITIFDVDATGADTVEKRIRQVIVQGQARFETLHRRKNGTLIEVEVVASYLEYGNGRFVVFVRDLTEEKQAEQKLLASKSRIQRKLQDSQSPGDDITGLELGDIIDINMLQSLSDAFHQLTGMVFALLDTQGKVFVAAGWQDICTKFHRINPETSKRCLKSDTILTRGLVHGESKRYRCENQLWDMATPLIIGGHHVGNIFTGQFILSDEEPNRETFRQQARQFGFNEQEYLDALDKVPRLSSTQVDTVMHFYSKLADMLATLSYSNVNLVWSIAEKDALNTRLQASEETYRTYVDSSPVAIFVINKQGQFVDVNPAGYAMTGYTREELTQLHISQLVVRDPNKNSDTGFQPLHSKERFFGEVSLRRKDGGTIYVLLNAVNIGPDTDLAFCQDISLRRQAETDMLKAKTEAEASNRAKSTFLANMSHEIRTPLNGILGMLQLLRTTPLDLEQQEYTLNAIKSSQRLTRLLSDILDLSKIEADKLPLETVEFSLEEQKRSVVETFTPLLNDKGLDMRFHIDERIPPTLIGDETRLRQILFNLVGNAIKFTEKGWVEVVIHPLSPPWCSKARILIAVSDTGIGIPDERLGDIFEPFTQIEGNYRRNFQGAGLGLPIVKNLVQLMGGNISISDTECGGTTIYVSLPFAFAQSPLAEEADTLPPCIKAESTPTILIADDDNLSLLAASKILQRMGSEIIAVKNGREVLQALSSQKVDLVLMDIQMPVMDGVETTKQIRSSNAPYAEIPIIAMTAYAMKNDKSVFLNAGMNDYVAKPVEIELLQKAINNALGSNSCHSPIRN